MGRRTDYEYDVQGRLTAVTLPEIGGSGSDAHYRPRYEYGYDAYGNQATVVADAYLDGTTVHYQKYDSTGSLQSDGTRTLSAAPLVHGEVTRYAYDYAGRQISRTLPSGEVETFEYDGLGRQTKHTSFEGKVTTYVYEDGIGTGGRVSEVHYFANATNAASNTADEVVTYAYDARGRVSSVNNGTTSAAVTLSYLYDAEGGRRRCRRSPAATRTR